MKVVSITSRKLKKLPELQISDKITSKEGRLYIYESKERWNHLREIIKIYYNQTESYLADKIYTISQLLAQKEFLDIPELVVPSALLSVDGNICGLTMPYIESNINLSLLLNNPKVDLETKLKYLKEIYRILEKAMNIKELEGNFFLGDIHEANFILDIDEQMIRAVDMDSIYIFDSPIGISKYLTFNPNILDNPEKYPHNEDDRAIPNKNTTVLCFVYMLLNALSGNKDSYKWSFNEFFSYLHFLERNGCSHELIKAIQNVYSKSKTNEFEIEVLDSIDTNKDYTLSRAHIPKTESKGYYK